MKRKFQLHAPLPFTLGFELTAIYSKYKEIIQDGHGYTPKHLRQRNQSIGCIVAQELSHKYRHLRKFDQSYYDGHCVEIPSPVCTTIGQAVEFYKDAWKLLRKFRYQPKHHITVDGGNHLHFGITDTRWIVEIMRHLAMHPEIIWVFTEPDDTDSAKPFYYIDYWMRHNIRPLLFQLFNFDYCNRLRKTIPEYKSDGSVNSDTKEFAICRNNKGKTLEFRCVETPKNLGEFLDQIEFFLTYALYIKNRLENGMGTHIIPLTPEELNEIPLQIAENNFYKLLADMGLDKKKYMKYVKRNLRPKWEMGRQRIEP